MNKSIYLIFLLLTQFITMCAVSKASREDKQHLEHFQNFGDTNSLLEFVKQSGRNLQTYQEAVDSLSPVFEALSFGEQPRYEALNPAALQRRRAEVTDIVRWMADSPKADMKTIALELMGVLGWNDFRPDLEQSLGSDLKWERLTAIKALGQITDKWAVEALTAVSKDKDPEIREAALQALKTKRD